MLTERDIFFSNQPQILLSPYTYDQLASAFDYPDFINLDELIDHIYKKYNRIDLASYNPPVFLDYETKNLISLDDLNRNFNEYSPMALQRLGYQIEPYLQQGVVSLQPLYNRISALVNNILSTNVLIEV